MIKVLNYIKSDSDYPQKITSKILQKDQYIFLKKGIWVYFLLLIFEGALRRWFLPSLSNPLLIIRDPIALWLILAAWHQGLLRPNSYIIGMILISVASIFTAIFIGHGNLLVAIYGARIGILHFPLLFVIGRIFDRDDVLAIGKVILLMATPMAILITFQFYSPQSAWVNRGVGGSLEGAGFSGALGFFRPPGTFSFITGTTQFFSLVASFVLYFWLFSKNINKYVLVAATISLLAAIPLSISRTLFFSVGVCILFSLFASSQNPSNLIRIVSTCILSVVVLAILSQLSFFQTAVEAFTARFEGANESEGGLQGVLGDRYIGGMINSIVNSTNLPFWGYGIGIGTSVGGTLLLGQAGLQVGEDEWTRIISELGLLMGGVVIIIRLTLSGKMLIVSYQRLRQNDFLPWMLLSFGILIIPQGQLAQPTSLGFSTLVGGLIIASLRDSPNRRKTTG